MSELLTNEIFTDVLNILKDHLGTIILGVFIWFKTRSLKNNIQEVSSQMDKVEFTAADIIEQLNNARKDTEAARKEHKQEQYIRLRSVWEAVREDINTKQPPSKEGGLKPAH